MRNSLWDICSRIGLPTLCLFFMGCGTQSYVAQDVVTQDFLQRKVTLHQDEITVSAAVPDATETERLTGLDLYGQGIQPIWLRVNNGSKYPLRLVPWSIDRDYFSPVEVAYKNRKRFNSKGYADMERWFYRNAVARVIPAGEVREGLVYTNLMHGTKAFNLDLLTRNSSLDFTFFVPLPGFTPDFTQVDFASLYDESQIDDLELEQLRDVLENDLDCCSRSAEGNEQGAPINTVLVGSPSTVRKALLRGQWIESEVSAEGAIGRARRHQFLGRSPDAVYSKARQEGNERLQLHLWLSPWRINDQPVWVGQVYYFTELGDFIRLFQDALPQGVQLKSFIASESTSADMDSAKRFLAQNLWYSGSLSRLGYVSGGPLSSMNEPASSFDGFSYFTDGRRMIAFLADEPLALDELQYVYDAATPQLAAREGYPNQERRVPPPNDRLQVKREGPITITTAVLSAKEARETFDVNLYAKNIQPVWVQVENTGDSALYLSPMGLDPAYFTAREAANRSSNKPIQGFARTFEERGHGKLTIPPRSISSGYIFSRVDEGTKSFNVDVIGESEAFLMNFTVPVPGLKVDHYQVEVATLYPKENVREVGLAELVSELEALPCCVLDANGEDRGDPLNLVFIGEVEDLYYALMRAGWDETETIYSGSVLRTGISAVSGEPYRYSPVSALYLFDRAQDAALQKARDSIHERNHLRIWLTPLRHQGKPVWAGQISRDIGVRFTFHTITTHKIDPQVDETREYLLEDLAYSQSLLKFGYVDGVGAAGYDQPRGNLTGDPYFTDGRRLVLWITGQPVGLDEISVVDLSQDSVSERRQSNNQAN